MINDRPIHLLPQRPPQPEPGRYLHAGNLTGLAKQLNLTLPPIDYDPSLEDDGTAASFQYELKAYDVGELLLLTPVLLIAVGRRMTHRYLPGAILHELLHQRVLLDRLRTRPRSVIERLQSDRASGHDDDFARMARTLDLPFETPDPTACFPFGETDVSGGAYEDWARTFVQGRLDRSVDKRSQSPNGSLKRRRLKSRLTRHVIAGLYSTGQAIREVRSWVG